MSATDDGPGASGTAVVAVRRVLDALTGADASPDDLYAAAVRIVMRTAFARLATSHGLPVPAGAMPTALEVDQPVLDAVADDLAFLDGTEVDVLGYLYETLLPSGSRKDAGAHYTPRELADEVVAHALEPLLADGVDVLDLRVADITAGSGVFLVAAARWLASRRPVAISEVITHCLYGADLDPTAVEISRLTLWLLAADPGLSLDVFADRIRCGDALLEETWAGWEKFDAVIGNPPFLGVKNIRGAIGQERRDHYARILLGGESGRSDLVVFFLARAASLSRDVVALVLPDAIAEGDSSRFGLGRLLEAGAGIYRADTSRPWPSEAGVRIALVWLRVAGTNAAGTNPGGVLDGTEVPEIGPSLGRARSAAAPITRTPPAWMPHGHQATIVLGKSLLLTRTDAAAMVAEDPRAATWIRDYLSGDDLVSTVGPSSTRQVLDLGSTELDELLAFAPIARRLDVVRAERAAQFAKYPQLRRRWWGFLAPVERLYDALVGEPEAIAFSKHAKYVWPVLVPTGPVFSNGAIVYPTADRAVYGFLASEPHRLWAIQEGGSRLNQSHRYNPSRTLTTYPFPDSIDGVRAAGEQLATAMETARDGLGLGVTGLLNLLHSVTAPAPEIVQIRAAIVEVDTAVLAAHGFDLAPEHALRTEGERTWFGLDPATATELKDRLLGRE